MASQHEPVAAINVAIHLGVSTTVAQAREYLDALILEGCVIRIHEKPPGWRPGYASHYVYEWKGDR